VAVQDGKVIQLGHSRKLGRFLVLRDVHGDVYTYAGLGSVASSYAPGKAPRTPSKARINPLVDEPAPKQAGGAPSQLPFTLTHKAPTPGSSKVRLFAHPGNPDAAAAPARATAPRSDRHSTPTGRLPLRVGSVISQGTVLGAVQVPPGAKDGHLRFAIRPAGDPQTIDPRPILANWRQLQSALHPQGAKGESELIGAILKAAASRVAHLARARRSAPKAAHSAGAGRSAPSPLAMSGELTSAQWDQLIARIGVLQAPTVAAKPSTAAIPDPWTSAGRRGSGNGPLPSGR